MFITTLFSQSRIYSYISEKVIFCISNFGKKSFCPRKNIFHKVVINRFVKNVYICEQKEPKI